MNEYEYIDGVLFGASIAALVCSVVFAFLLAIRDPE